MGCKDCKGTVEDTDLHPLQTGLSPSELLMGRRLRTQLPILAKTSTPRDLKREREEVVKKEEIYRSNQRQSFNQRHRAKELPDLTNGDLYGSETRITYGNYKGALSILAPLSLKQRKTRYR